MLTTPDIPRVIPIYRSRAANDAHVAATSRSVVRCPCMNRVKDDKNIIVSNIKRASLHAIIDTLINVNDIRHIDNAKRLITDDLRCLSSKWPKK